jgi:hypothetical protein
MKCKRRGIILLTLLLSACSSAILLEKSDIKNVIVDANPSEWKGKFYNFEDKKIGVAYTNDNQNLYLCITFRDFRSFAPVLRGGLTLWVESDNRKVGLKYPLVYRERRTGDFNRDMPGNREEMRKMFEKRLQEFLGNQNEIEILNEENYPLALINKFDNTYGIIADINRFESEIIYELQMPIGTGLINRGDDNLIKVKIETEEPARMNADFGGGMRGSREGARLQRFANMFEPLELEFSLKLSF